MWINGEADDTHVIRLRFWHLCECDLFIFGFFFPHPPLSPPSRVSRVSLSCRVSRCGGIPKRSNNCASVCALGFWSGVLSLHCATMAACVCMACELCSTATKSIYIHARIALMLSFGGRTGMMFHVIELELRRRRCQTSTYTPVRVCVCVCRHVLCA